MRRIHKFAPWFLLFIFASLSTAATHIPGMTVQILTASPSQTVLAVEFDAATTIERVSSLTDGARATDGYGTILAIAGHGTPTSQILHYELGDVIRGASALDESEVAASPGELVILGEPAIWHDLRIVAVNYRPVMRDASGEVRAVTSLQAEISTGGSGINEQAEPTSFSSAFYSAYQSVVENLDELYPILSIRPPGRMLVIIPPGPYADLSTIPPPNAWQDWLELKNRKGYQVQIATLEMIRQATGDSSKVGIRNYIQQAYNSTDERDLEYVVIFGDATPPFRVMSDSLPNPEVPDEHSVGDNYYFRVDGNDYIPDILSGRVSVASVTEVILYLTKVYQYETNPYTTDPAWFSSVTCVAGNYADGSQLYPVTPVWNVNWARDRLMQDGCITDADTFYYHGLTDPPPGTLTCQIISDINDGVCMVLYRGWAASQGWQYPLVVNQSFNQCGLSTGRQNPAVFSIVCGSGNFAYPSGRCFGEEFILRGAQNGAIVFYGATDIHTNTRHNNAILAGIVDAQMVTSERSTGALGAVGEMEAYRQFPLERDPNGSNPSEVEYYVFHVFNTLGDPETQLYICQPGILDVAYLDTLTEGAESVAITVTSGGYPVEHAVVTLRAGQTGEVNSTLIDATGQAWLDVDLTNATVAQLTVWKDTYFMRWIDIPVTSADFDPAISSVNWQDGNDNLPNPGELAPFTLTVENAGNLASDYSIIAMSQDPRITVVNGTATIGTLQPGQTGTSTQMSIALGSGLMDGELPRLDFQLTGVGSLVRTTQVPVTAPNALVLSLVINDGNNGILEPGETASVSVTIQNNGHQNASNLTATVYSWDNAVSFSDATLGWGAVSIGQTVASSDNFQVTLANGVTPGRQILLRYDISSSGTLLGATSQWLTAGVVTINAPTGPDGYGYYAYENIDAGFTATPTYNWIELDPSFGGSDGISHIVHDDEFFAMGLPQPFHFYGQSYDSVWICSNGWFSFEPITVPEFRNWELPMPMAPNKLVAPFWEDLVSDTTLPNNPASSGPVWTRVDTSPDRFIILWRAFNRACLTGTGNECPEVFEAILEYNGQNDGNILIQFNQVAQEDWESNPSNYSTVGIQNFDLRTGLTLTYANMYPPSVDTLRTGRAIRFTTTPPDNFLGADDPIGRPLPTEYAFHDAYPNPFNPLTELRFDLPEASRVSLIVYDMLGRERAILVDDFRAAGSYQVTFDGQHLPSGLYFARFSSGTFSQVKKLMLVK